MNEWVNERANQSVNQWNYFVIICCLQSMLHSILFRNYDFLFVHKCFNFPDEYPRELRYTFEKTTVCSKKSDAKIEIIITATNLIRIKYPLSSLNYQLSGANVANFNKIHCKVFEQQLFKKWSSKTEVSNVEKSPYQFVRNTTSYSLCSKWSPFAQTLASLLCRPYVLCCWGFPVCRPCSCVNLPQKSVQCWTIPVLVRKFLQQLSGTVTLIYSALKHWSVFRPLS